MNNFLSAFAEDSGGAYTILRYLLFPMLLLLVGGITAHILYPRWQDSFLRRKALTERRSALGEDIVALMNAYVVSWRRLIEAASFGSQTDALSAAEQAAQEKQITTLAGKRSDARDALMAALSRFQLYCRAADRSEIDAFITWDESQSQKRLNELPDIKEWRKWEDQLRARVSRVLQSAGR